jgi:dTDP-4-dehydrorhamnose reductase
LKNKIFLIGASGRLGSFWLKKLQKKNNVISHQHSKKILSKCIKLNLIDKKKLTNFCIKENINVIINCSGYANVEKSEKFPNKAKMVNYLIVKNLTDVCKLKNIKLIHVSTDHIFDGKKKKYHENSIAKPLNVYSKTKFAAEKYIRKKLKKYLIFRTNFFLRSKMQDTFVDEIVKKLKRNKPVYCWQNIFYNPVHVSTLVRIANILIKGDYSGVYNIGSNQYISKYEFALLVAKHLKFDTKLIKKSSYINSIVKRPLNMSLSNQKIKKVLKLGKKTKFFDISKEIKNV